MDAHQVLTAEELIAFEAEMADLFNVGKIAAPLHLAGGNEKELIKIFQDIRPQDYVLATWRAHYHSLLKGVKRETLREKILEGRSIGLCFPEQRVLCSALVGGIAPIAVGIAWGIKHSERDELVYCFLGDMAAQAGVVHESIKYAYGHDLPVKWVIEDNEMSVGTHTATVWGNAMWRPPNVIKYNYKLKWPHVGSGTWVSF